MKNSLNILTQQKQQEIDDKIKEKQNKEILQSLKKDIIIILDDKIKKYYNNHGAFYILSNEQDIIDGVLQDLDILSNDYITHNVNCNYNNIPELIKIDLINDLFYKEFKKVKKRVDDFNKYKNEEETKKSGIPKIWLIYLGLKFLNKKLKK
jgi:hypothetical protein